MRAFALRVSLAVFRGRKKKMSTTLVRFFPCIQTEALYGHLLLKSGTLGLSWCFFRCCATPPPPFFLFFFFLVLFLPLRHDARTALMPWRAAAGCYCLNSVFFFFFPPSFTVKCSLSTETQWSCTREFKRPDCIGLSPLLLLRTANPRCSILSFPFFFQTPVFFFFF